MEEIFVALSMYDKHINRDITAVPQEMKLEKALMVNTRNNFSSSTKDGLCNYCKKPGHIARKCYAKIRDDNNKGGYHNGWDNSRHKQDEQKHDYDKRSPENDHRRQEKDRAFSGYDTRDNDYYKNRDSWRERSRERQSSSSRDGYRSNSGNNRNSFTNKNEDDRALRNDIQALLAILTTKQQQAEPHLHKPSFLAIENPSTVHDYSQAQTTQNGRGESSNIRPRSFMVSVINKIGSSLDDTGNTRQLGNQDLW